MPASRSVVSVLFRSWETFLYTLKRRLRAGRKRPVLAAEYRAPGSPHPPARRSTTPPSTLRRLLFPAWA
jgi:hypothetical protein